MSIEIQNIVRADPSVTVSVLMEMIKQQYGYMVKYRRVWQAKRKALVVVFGDWDKSYNKLPYWLSAVVHYNPGTRVDWFLLPSDVPGTTIFGRVFWAFGPAIEGFKYCRPLIQIDGIHLYGKYKGKMLTALSIDANGHIFPLAFAIVEGENASSWSWFLYALRQYVTDRDGICLISDRHRGILSVINNEEIGWSEPRAFHRYCLRHVANNFNNKYKSKQLKDLVFRADIDLQKWTQSHDNGYRYGWMTSKAAECMNGVFKGARIMDPGPVDDSHLYLQATHRSQSIWDTSSTVVLSCRRREAASQRTIPFDQRIAPYLEAAGFLGVSQVGFMQLDWHLITALVERWRPVTHTFHMPCGECTITLQDVAVQLGVASGWGASNRIIKFEELPLDADIVSVQRYARAYIMQLIGGFLFANKSNTLVHFLRDRWPIDVATSMDIRQILHYSSTENVVAFRWSTFEFQINWTPYTPDIMASLPVRCQSGQAVWTYVGPLICFHLVEKHQPDRILRQFNMLQTPPAISYTDQRLHQIDLRGKHDQDWRRIHAEHIGVWNSRYDFRVEAPTTSEPTV
ncbi:uncharacterized protein E6C27_scaffold497G00050 [Cucumis melo var. makuwa]|uniref:Serine/threonine-protein phosphatase 7 long form-like protein n=1 Tax=Cucumis melo var. makuwa TaxID=1194695 RepID=A0A5A7UVF4_CUCMM|nr:uncharacterized protein E6C27_scaffold497G00050 [Cucumis melo var. makuwa]